MALVLLDKTDGVATITLNRPEAMNALSRALRAELSSACQDVSSDNDIHALIITGAGERAFTAGLDLKELGESGLGPANDRDASTNPVFALTEMPIPVIGAINGVAITGGFELALACDIRIASTNARFADTHARVGITPGWGLSQKLSRFIGLSRACELSFTGQFLDAQTARDWGLVNHVYQPDELMPAALALARDMTTIDRNFLKVYKNLIMTGFDRNLAEGMAYENEISVPFNAKVSMDEVEKRRLAIIERGRKLKG
ncbi:enoyl-CoA hydratase [Parasphingorhabdus flavimaris]|uniref:enoyl-CoA hydratase n=1 Tax=Parasphingorhabdus flavimaris TaxID=266812 RepID=UPI003001A6D5